MKLIEKADLNGFNDYMLRTENTICGENPIKILMSIMQALKLNGRFLRYEQSDSCKSLDDSSVSYASAVIIS